MKIEEFFLKYLKKKGLWSSEAVSVIEEMKNNMPDMRHYLEDEMSGYSSQLLAALKFAVDNEAAQWLDQHKPNHFARRLFPRYEPH